MRFEDEDVGPPEQLGDSAVCVAYTAKDASVIAGICIHLSNPLCI